MNVGNTCLTCAVLLLCLPQGFCFRVDWTVPLHFPYQWLSPLFRPFWARPPPAEKPDTTPPKVLTGIHGNAGNDVSPGQSVLNSAKTSMKSADSKDAGSSGPDGLKQWSPQTAGMEQMKSSDVNRFEVPGELQKDASKYQEKKAEKEPSKRPFDTENSVFEKKYLDSVDKDVKEGKVEEPLAMDTVNQPFKQPGMGVGKESFPFPDAENPLTAKEKESVEDKEQRVDTGSVEKLHEKQPFVELIKQGLGVIETELMEKKDMDTVGSGLIKRGLSQLSQSLGSDQPTKEVDMDTIRQGLDNVGEGLILHGLDPEGLELIKQGVDKVETGLTRRSPVATKALVNEGVSLVKKGLDYLETGLVKHGVDVEAFGMIKDGLEDLSKWMIQQRSHNKIYQTVKTKGDKKTETIKDKLHEYKRLKAGFDKLSSQLSKKRSDIVEDFNKDEVTFFKKNLDVVGAGLIKKDKNDVKADTIKEDKDDVKAALIKEDKIEPDKNDKNDVKAKKEEDDIEADFYKKELDDVDKEILRKELIWGKAHDKKSEDKPGKSDEKSAFNNKEQNVKQVEKSSYHLNPKAKAKGSDDVNMEMTKKSLDDANMGFEKKELDYVGSGLIKKESDDKDSSFGKTKPGTFKFNQPEDIPSKERNKWQTKASYDHKSHQFLKKYEEEKAQHHKKSHDMKQASKSL